MIPNIPRMVPNIPRLMPNIPSVHLRVSTSLFFDRAEIKAAMSDMQHKALFKASRIVIDRARRIIKKRGLARIPKALRREYPGMGPAELHRAGGLLGKTWTQSRTRMRLIVREVQRPKGSPPGTPPFTHTPTEGHQASYLGFRRNLWNYFDPQTRSAVAGPSKKGRMLPFLHEFGGRVDLKTWVYVPQIKTKMGGMRSPIVMKMAAGAQPKDTSRWRPLRSFEHKATMYPARPFMRPAMEFCVSNGSIARAFRGAFQATAGHGTAGFTIRQG